MWIVARLLLFTSLLSQETVVGPKCQRLLSEHSEQASFLSFVLDSGLPALRKHTYYIGTGCILETFTIVRDILRLNAL